MQNRFLGLKLAPRRPKMLQDCPACWAAFGASKLTKISFRTARQDLCVSSTLNSLWIHGRSSAALTAWTPNNPRTIITNRVCRAKTNYFSSIIQNRSFQVRNPVRVFRRIGLSRLSKWSSQDQNSAPRNLVSQSKISTFRESIHTKQQKQITTAPKQTTNADCKV